MPKATHRRIKSRPYSDRRRLFSKDEVAILLGLRRHKMDERRSHCPDLPWFKQAARLNRRARSLVAWQPLFDYCLRHRLHDALRQLGWAENVLLVGCPHALAGELGERCPAVEVHYASDPFSAGVFVARRAPCAVVFDLRQDQGELLESLRSLRKTHPHIRLVALCNPDHATPELYYPADVLVLEADAGRLAEAIMEGWEG